MRDRKIKTTACVLLAALLLGGCGEQPIELTEQEEQTIVDYAAHVVSKYNIKQQDGIVRLSKSEETTETADTEAVEQPDSTEQMSSEGGDATGTPENAASDNSVSLNDAVAIPGIDTQYTGAEFATVYQQNSSYMVQDKGVSTGVIKLDGQLIVILDFEKIISDISPETGLKVSDVEHLENRNRNDSPIMIAEDSPLLSKLITDCLKKAGYTNLNVNTNGQEAWDKLCAYEKAGNVKDKVHCIITDIEMPLMDGHRLTKLVKENDNMHDIPVIIFSSLVNDEMRRKGESLGADAQLTKPEIGSLVQAIDRLIDQTGK